MSSNMGQIIKQLRLEKNATQEEVRKNNWC